VVEQFEAFSAGWNDQLTNVGRRRLAGWCAGADWVRPITAVEVYTYARSTALQASSAALAASNPGGMGCSGPILVSVRGATPSPMGWIRHPGLSRAHR